MHDHYQQNDLILVRPKQAYQIGDAVLYRNPQLGQVFHRIIGKVSEGFFMKGDNNTWVDSFLPSDEDIYGSIWIHIPNAGTIVKFLRTPFIFSTILTASILILIQVWKSSTNRATRIICPTDVGHARKFRMNYKLTDLLYLSLISLLCFSILAFFAFQEPIEHEIPDNLNYTNRGQFDYFAVTTGDVYQEGFLASGDPVFRLLTDSVNILFHYELSADQTGEIHGTNRMVAEISDATGWKYPIELLPTTTFTGNEFTLQSTLELNQLQEIIDKLETQTGIHNAAYTLNILPEVHIEGALQERPFTSDFTPQVAFVIDDLTMRIIKNEESVQDPLLSTQMGIIQDTKIESNTISFFGIELNVLLARMIAGYGIFFSLVMLFWTFRRYKKLQDLDEITRIKLQYGLTFIDVREGYFLSKNIIEVENLQELALIASQDQSMIYHHISDDYHHYYVTPKDNANITYHYQVLFTPMQAMLTG